MQFKLKPLFKDKPWGPGEKKLLFIIIQRGFVLSLALNGEKKQTGLIDIKAAGMQQVNTRLWVPQGFRSSSILMIHFRSIKLNVNYS